MSRNNIKHKYNFIKDKFNNEGYVLLSDEYINAHKKLKVKCPKGHEFDITWNNFQQGRRCPYERYKKAAKKQKHSYKYIKEQVEKEGYQLLSKKYINDRTKLDMICNNGHKCSISYNNFKRDRRCYICFGKFSKSEKEIVDYIKSFDIEVIENDKTKIINPLTNYALELDIFIPELNKAIEFNGRYWHSFNDAIERDKIKGEQCKENKIDLLIIKEQDWMDDKHNCLNDVNLFIGV